MRNKVNFIPEPDFNKHTLLPSSTLSVYDSSVEGAISVMMTQGGVVQAGIRLTHYQASALARTLVNLLGDADDDPHTIGFEVGYDVGRREGFEDGEREGFNAGWSQGHDEGRSDGDGWDEGYELGYERGYNDGREEVA